MDSVMIRTQFAISLGVLLENLPRVFSVLECELQRVTGRSYYSPYSRIPPYWNHTIHCPPSSFTWEWTLARLCCYDNYDRFYERPYCCYSEMYKLLVAVGFVVLFVLGVSFFFFFCWFYNLPHHLLYCFTCGRFLLNDWLFRMKNGGSHVDPSLYLKEPFWSRSHGVEDLTYPLRPMPPRIFYPAPPTNLKFRGWDLGHGEIPLFVLASRQFHRNPYSARPHERTPHTVPLPYPTTMDQSRRGSLASTNAAEVFTISETFSEGNRYTSAGPLGSAGIGVGSTPATFRIAGSGKKKEESKSKDNRSTPAVLFPLDEEEVASELKEALRLMDEKDQQEEDFVNNFIKQQSTTANENANETNMSRRGSAADRLSRSSSLEGPDEPTDPPHPSTADQRVRFSTGKVSVRMLNQQLSNSLTLSISNLPNIQVIGNFRRGDADGMETIEEDEDPPYCPEDEDYEGIESQEELQLQDNVLKAPSAKRKPKSPHKVKSPEKEKSSPKLPTKRAPSGNVTDFNLARNMPGAVPDCLEEEGGDLPSRMRGRGRERNTTTLNRRNSAPVYS